MFLEKILKSSEIALKHRQINDFGPGARLLGVVFRILEAIAALFLWCGNSLLDVVSRNSTYVIVDQGDH